MATFEEALKRYNSPAKPTQRSKGKSKSNATHVCIDPYTLEEVEDREGAICFDSRLEATVFRFLSRNFEPSDIQRQKRLSLAYDSDTDIELKWKPDFYIESKNVYLEAKGAWINRVDCKGEKSLFTYQYVLAKSQGNQVLVCSDEYFKIGRIEVIDYVTAVKTILGIA